MSRSAVLARAIAPGAGIATALLAASLVSPAPADPRAGRAAERIVAAAIPTSALVDPSPCASSQNLPPYCDSEIATAAARGSNYRHLTENTVGDFSPAVAPSGSQIVVVRGSDEESTRLHRIKSNGTEIGPILLGGLSDPHSPSYSADGRWIVFSARLDGQYDLFRVAPDGARLRRLTNTPERDRYAAVSPGNRMIAFACGPALCRIKPDGTRRRVLFDPNDFHTVRSIDFFPSGRSLVFLFENAEYGFLSLRTIRASGKGIRTMRLSRQELEGGSFDLSADGRRLVIADDGQLGVMKLSRNRRHALWVRAIRTPSGERFADPAWLVPRG